MWSIAIEPTLLRVREVSVRSPSWPVAYPALRIALVGDIHLGAPHVDLVKVDQVVAAVNAAAPDLVLLLGDYVSMMVLGRQRVSPEQLTPGLARLRAPYGVVAVLGNHDWWYDGPAVAAALEAAGIVVLENEARRIALPAGPLWIAGIADDMTRVPDVAGTLDAIPRGEPVVVAAHNPVSFLDVPPGPVITFAAHTHGGQVYLPLVGALVTPGRTPTRFAYGHIREGGRDLTVTAGIGTSILPIRFNMPPEIVIVRIEAEAREGDAVRAGDRS